MRAIRVCALVLTMLIGVVGAVVALASVGFQPWPRDELQDSYYVMRDVRDALSVLAFGIVNAAAVAGLARPDWKAVIATLAGLWMILAGVSIMMVSRLAPMTYLHFFGPFRVSDFHVFSALSLVMYWGTLVAMAVLVLGWLVWITGCVSGRAR
jgi:hypothetical protein